MLKLTIKDRWKRGGGRNGSSIMVGVIGGDGALLGHYTALAAAAIDLGLSGSAVVRTLIGPNPEG